MRDELHVMELVDRYLDGDMGEAERVGFEQRMGGNAELASLVNDQRALREGMLRVHLRQAAAGARRVWIFKRMLPWIAGVVLLLGTAAYLVIGSEGERHAEDVEHIEASTTANDGLAMADTALASEVEALKVETVFIEHRIDSALVGPPVKNGPIGALEWRAPIATTSEARKEQQEGGSVAYDVRTRMEQVSKGDSIGHHTASDSSAAVKPLLATVEQPGNADQQPSYPGGWDAMQDFLKANLRVPRNLRESRTVLVSFVVDRKGDIRDAEVVESGSTKLDNEALRVIALMPTWVPCKVGDKPVKSRIEVPIRFGGDDTGVAK